MSKPIKGFLTDYERDSLLLFLYGNVVCLMDHLGAATAGGSVDYHKMKKRRNDCELSDTENKT